MLKVQVIENESFLKKADFDNCEVWLLNRTTEEELDERVINVAEITESLLDTASKFPKLLTEIYNAHPVEQELDDKGNIISVTVTWDYEILTDDPEHFAIHAYVCDFKKIKIIEE